MSRFPTTKWTLVNSANSREDPGVRSALSDLCEAYWPPLYAFVRMKGLNKEDAQDMVQGFFERLLTKDDLVGVDRGRGRFRSYLMGAINHYMADEWDRAKALKRGGGAGHVSLGFDFEKVERQFEMQAAGRSDPERIFNHRWAIELLNRVLEYLRAEYGQAGQLERYETLIPFVTGEQDDATYRDAGQLLGISEGAARVAAHRLKRRYKEAVREEVAATVSDERDVEEELLHLMQALSV